jgi:transcriptional regulator with XRE-family HTH domain
MKENLGKQLKTARERRGMTLREVEDKTGISNAYLSQLENGKITEPSPRVLFKLAEIYKLPYSLLMELAGYPGKTKSTTAKYRIASELSDLNKDEEKKLIEYLEFLRSQVRKK